jgi:hypothetical protein
MAVFEAISVSWEGKEYTIPADRVMGAIVIIEDVFVFAELVEGVQTGKLAMNKLARAYGGLLRYAGARVGDEDVYGGMFRPGKLQDAIAKAINTLMVIMTPPEALKAVGNAEADGAQPSGNVQASRSGSSRPYTRRRSVAAG